MSNKICVEFRDENNQLTFNQYDKFGIHFCQQVQRVETMKQLYDLFFAENKEAQTCNQVELNAWMKEKGLVSRHKYW